MGTVDGAHLSIIGYQEVTDPSDLIIARRWTGSPSSRNHHRDHDGASWGSFGPVTWR